VKSGHSRRVAELGKVQQWGDMSDEDPGPGDGSKAFAGMMGLAALLAWFATLWFMFGDVL
jgi:hypothetical protein